MCNDTLIFTLVIRDLLAPWNTYLIFFRWSHTIRIHVDDDYIIVRFLRLASIVIVFF